MHRLLVLRCWTPLIFRSWFVIPGGDHFENPGTKAPLSQLRNRDLILPVHDLITMSGAEISNPTILGF
jgi:hypothetical protein